MSRSIFGWSLPPGCSNSDIDRAFGAEGPCARCGEAVDDCECPECPTCGSVGCLTHESKEFLWRRLEQMRSLVLDYENELKRRNLPLAYQEPDFGPPEEEIGGE